MSAMKATSTQPVGYYCDHSDEPLDARTHHGWEWDEEYGGRTFQHLPDTISAIEYADRAYLTPEENERRCPRALPLYTADVPALVAEVERLRAERLPSVPPGLVRQIRLAADTELPVPVTYGARSVQIFARDLERWIPETAEPTTEQIEQAAKGGESR